MKVFIVWAVPAYADCASRRQSGAASVACCAARERAAHSLQRADACRAAPRRRPRHASDEDVRPWLAASAVDSRCAATRRFYSNRAASIEHRCRKMHACYICCLYAYLCTAKRRCLNIASAHISRADGAVSELRRGGRRRRGRRRRRRRRRSSSHRRGRRSSRGAHRGARADGSGRRVFTEHAQRRPESPWGRVAG